MPDGGYQVDPGVLEGIASTLRNAAAKLDGLGRNAPATPDAGDASAAVAAILAKLSDSAGQLVIGTNAASDAVADGGQAYVDTDEQVSASVTKSGGR